jgi:hypothetical protein
MRAGRHVMKKTESSSFADMAEAKAIMMYVLIEVNESIYFCFLLLSSVSTASSNMTLADYLLYSTRYTRLLSCHQRGRGTRPSDEVRLAEERIDVTRSCPESPRMAKQDLGTSITRPPSSLTEARRYVTDGVRLAQSPRRGASRRLR